jgi:replication-associated recombination protein RarA
LFVDEVHRWNKAQQDALLPHVETGMITLIGATTENPYFEVIRALVSRSRIFQLTPLGDRSLASCSTGPSWTKSAVMAGETSPSTPMPAHT